MTAHGNNNRWSLEREELLRRLWAEGKPASEIASILGNGQTRLSIYGKAFRLGLSKRKRTGEFDSRPSAPTRYRAPPVKSDRWAGSMNARGNKPPKPGPQRKPAVILGYVQTTNAAEAEKLANALAEQGRKVLDRFTAVNDDAIRLMDRRRFQCSWPVGIPARPAEQLCCGQPVGPAASVATETYCDKHRRIAISAHQPKRKSPTLPAPRRVAA